MGIRTWATLTFTWWGDCENADMRWELRDAPTQDVILHSVPLSAADTTSQNCAFPKGAMNWCGTMRVGMGFSGSYDAENLAGSLLNSFEDIISDAQGIDFGEELDSGVCVSVPWSMPISMGMACGCGRLSSPCSPTLDAKPLLCRHRPRRQRGCIRFDEHAVRLWTSSEHRLKRQRFMVVHGVHGKVPAPLRTWPCVASKRHPFWPQLNALIQIGRVRLSLVVS